MMLPYCTSLRSLTHFAGLPGRNRTPSPSATAMTCARFVFVSMLTARRRRVAGIPDSGDGTGGSMIS